MVIQNLNDFFLYQDFMDYTDDKDYACFTPNQVSIVGRIAGACHTLSLSTTCSTLDGLNEYNQNKDAIIYNSNGYVTIKLFNIDKAKLSIYNLLGKQVKTITLNGDYMISTNEFTKGIYYLVIQNKDVHI